MPDETGVTTWTATRLQMIDALQQIPVQDPAPQPAPRRRSRLRKAPAAVPHQVTCPLDVPGVADLILAHLPEAGAVQEISDAEFEAAKADVIARFGAVPLSLQRVADRGGRFGLPVITAMADSAVTLSLGDLAAKDAEIEREKRRAGEAGQELAELRAAHSAAIADVTERAGRLETEAASLRDGTAGLLVDTCKAEARADIARAALVRLAAPGTSITARRKIAADAVAELDAAAAGEAVAPDEPA
jgi:hypothetical protein